MIPMIPQSELEAIIAKEKKYCKATAGMSGNMAQLFETVSYYVQREEFTKELLGNFFIRYTENIRGIAVAAFPEVEASVITSMMTSLTSAANTVKSALASAGTLSAAKSAYKTYLASVLSAMKASLGEENGKDLHYAYLKACGGRTLDLLFNYIWSE